MDVRNQASSLINAITVQDDTHGLDFGSCAAQPGGSLWTFSALPSGGVQPGNSIGEQSDIAGTGGTLNGVACSASDVPTSLIAGTTYTFTVTVTFAAGGDNVQTLTLSAVT